MTQNKVNNDLEHYYNYYPTNKGKAFVGERAVMHGRDLLHELIDLDWMNLHFFSITGRQGHQGKLKAMMNAWTGCSYPDPRIWNNRIAALAGTTRSTAALGVGAATAVSEATIYGHRANKKCIDTLQRAMEAKRAKQSLVEFCNAEKAAGRRFYGYGRPINNQDERIAPMVKTLKSLGLFEDEFIQLCFELETHLYASQHLSMNITGLTAGLAASLGLTPTQYHAFLCPVFTIGFAPCYLDAIEKPPGCLFPMKCSDIEYSGPKARGW